LPGPRRTIVGIGVVCAGLGAGWDGLALAQTPALPRELPGGVEPGRIRPEPQLPSQPPFQFTIEQPGRSQVPRAVSELHFRLRGIRIEGATSIPPESFRPLYASLIGKEVTINNILDIADAVEDAYRRRGYVISHAFVPPQRVTNGIFTIKVVEGFVSAVTVEGGRPKTQALIRSYFGDVLAERPLRLATMERALLLANDVNGVAAAGVLRPAPNTPGASELVVSIVDSPVTAGLRMDNRGSDYQGIWTLGGDIEANGVAVAGDQLGVAYATSPNMLEQVAGQIRYSLPIGSDGLDGSMIATVTHGEPGGSLAPVELVTDSYAMGPRLRYPLVRLRDESLILDGGITVENAKVTALGFVLSDDHWRVADVGASYSLTALGGVTAASFDLAHGLPIFGATPNGSLELSRSGSASGNTSFTKVTATLHHSQDLYGPVSLYMAAQGQYSFEPLVAGEQIAFGGAAIGRGYDPGALTGDRGIGGSFELRYDTRFPQYGIELVQPYLFYDTAKVWNVHSAPSAIVNTAYGPVGTGSGLALSSAGLGVRFFLQHNITTDFEFARTMKAVIGSDNGRETSKFLVDASVRF
jgi:hemolysin activation/secretion protein